MTPTEVIEILPALWAISLLMGMIYRFEIEVMRFLLRLMP